MAAAEGATIEIQSANGHDLARGIRGLVFWGGPIGLILITSALGSLRLLSFLEAGVLLTFGAAWFGITCLVNALRCGRIHCWIDGTILPAWSVAGGLIVLGLIPLSLNTFAQVIWGVVLLSFIVEWVAGPYIRRPSHS